MDKRFEYVVATDMKELVTKLNQLNEKYYFSVVYTADGVAIIDTLVTPTVLVEESDFEIVPDDTKKSPSFA